MSAFSTLTCGYFRLTNHKQHQRLLPGCAVHIGRGGKHLDGPNAYFDELKERCNLFMDLRDNGQIQYLHNNVFDQAPTYNKMGGIVGLSKSLSELTLMAAVLNAAKVRGNAADLFVADRTFKISGRYQLSPVFDPGVYADMGNCYAFRRREPSWLEKAMAHIGTGHFFRSRLWSFTPSLLDKTLSTYLLMIQDLKRLGEQHYIDVEHLLFKFFSSESVVELDHVHVMGNIASTGAIVYD
jgi:hypothetical protein